MEVLPSHIDPTDPTFQSNRDRMQRLVAELRERLLAAREGGGAKYVERHREQGKLPVRDRIDRLLDPGSPFLELSPLAAWICTTTTRPPRASSRASGACQLVKCSSSPTTRRSKGAPITR